MCDAKELRIQALLRQMPSIGLPAVQRLFWAEFGYTPADEPVSVPAGVSVAGTPKLLARHKARSGVLDVIHIALPASPADPSPSLQRSEVCWAVRQLVHEHPEGLFVVSDRRERYWHFLSLSPADSTRARVLRGISVGPNKQPQSVVRHLAKLDLTRFGPQAPELPLEVIQKRLEAAFDAEALARAFLQDYRRVLAELQLDLLAQAGSPQRAHSLALQELNRLVFFRHLQDALCRHRNPVCSAKLWCVFRQAAVPGDGPTRGWLPGVHESLCNLTSSEHSPELPCGGTPCSLPPLVSCPRLGLLDPDDLRASSLANLSSARVEQVETFLEGYDFASVEDTPWVQWLAIGPQMMSSAYERLFDNPAEAAERYAAGLFYTPRVEIDLICRLALVDWLANHLGEYYKPLLYELVLALEPKDKASADIATADCGLWPRIDHLLCTVRVLDPACGGGSFLMGMLSVLDDLRARAGAVLGKEQGPFDRAEQTIRRSLYGIDLMGMAAEIARMRVFLYLASAQVEDAVCDRLAACATNLVAQIHRGDSLAGEADRAIARMVPDRLQSHEGGPPGSRGGPSFDLVIGNPPYVRQERIRCAEQPAQTLSKDDHREYKAALARTVYASWPETFGYDRVRDCSRWRLDSRSDLYIYFVLQGLSMLHPRGSMCFVTSNSWLDARFGKDLREFLVTRGQVKLVIDNPGHRSFADAFVNTVIVLMGAASDSRDPCESSLHHTVRFVGLSVPFREALFPLPWVAVEGVTHGGQDMSANCRVVALRQKDLLVRPAPGPHGATGWPAADRWGANYLRAPSIYRVVVKRCGDKLVRLGDVARVRRGVTTGANGFFFLDRHEQMHWGIEEEYLAEALRTPRQCRHIWLNHDREELDYLFVCRKGREELQGSSALEYIKHGESKGIHQRPTLKARSRWWDVGRPTGTYVHASYLVDSVMRFYASESPLLASDNFQELYSEIDPQMMAAACNGTFCQLSANVLGRTSLGRGLLKLQTYEVEELLIPSPHLLPPDIGRILQGAGFLGLDDPRRRDLDAAIFDVLDLTKEEQDSVCEELARMVESRLAKATSLEL